LGYPETTVKLVIGIWMVALLILGVALALSVQDFLSLQASAPAWITKFTKHESWNYVHCGNKKISHCPEKRRGARR
jgi:hypothetical protein